MGYRAAAFRMMRLFRRHPDPAPGSDPSGRIVLRVKKGLVKRCPFGHREDRRSPNWVFAQGLRKKGSRSYEVGVGKDGFQQFGCLDKFAPARFARRRFARVNVVMPPAKVGPLPPEGDEDRSASVRTAPVNSASARVAPVKSAPTRRGAGQVVPCHTSSSRACDRSWPARSQKSIVQESAPTALRLTPCRFFWR